MEKTIDNKRYFSYSSLSYELKKIYYNEIYKFLGRLIFEYQGFRSWYQGLFGEVYELHQNREIFICEDQLHIAGIAIIKNDFEEKKICTLRVAEQYQHQGIGHNLVEICLTQLDTEKPMITLHKNKLNQFENILRYYNFDLVQTQRHYYSIFSTELVFNGVLPQKKFIFNKIQLMNMERLYRDFIIGGGRNTEDFVNACILCWYNREKRRGIGIVEI